MAIIEDGFTNVLGYTTTSMSDSGGDIISVNENKELSKFTQVVIQGENNSQYVLFQIPRYYDGADLSKHKIKIKCKVPVTNTIVDVDVCDVRCSDEFIRFAWLLSKNVCEYSGIVEYYVYVSSTQNNFTWKTTISKFDVERTFESAGSSDTSSGTSSDTNSGTSSGENTGNGNIAMVFVDINGSAVTCAKTYRELYNMIDAYNESSKKLVFLVHDIGDSSGHRIDFYTLQYCGVGSISEQIRFCNLQGTTLKTITFYGSGSITYSSAALV